MSAQSTLSLARPVIHQIHAAQDKPPTPASSIQSCISPWLTPIAYSLLRNCVVPAFFGEVSIIGQEHLPKSGPVILAPTHRSRWDSMIMPYATGRHVTGRDLRFMVSADEMTGLQGWMMRHLGGFPVNPRQPAIASLRFGMNILRRRETMVIFPEGAIFRDRPVHPLRPGLARLAIQAESLDPSLRVKIVPIDLHYSDPIPTRGTDVNVKIGRPLNVRDYCESDESSKVQARHLTTDLTQALEALL